MPPAHAFFQLTLRTTDVAGARGFYARVLGPAALDIVQLHEQALARGARPHWLGFVEVADVDRATTAFLERGATALGPKWVNPKGLEAATLRDPGGAIVALGKPPAGADPEGQRARGPEVSRHVLNTPDAPRAQATYGALFDWSFGPPEELEGLGTVRPFGWGAGLPAAGAIVDVASRPGVHPHWLFHFRVPALGPAIEAVKAGGGLVVAEFTLPTGARIAVCDDAQGAAFALEQPAKEAP